MLVHDERNSIAGSLSRREPGSVRFDNALCYGESNVFLLLEKLGIILAVYSRSSE